MKYVLSMLIILSMLFSSSCATNNNEFDFIDIIPCTVEEAKGYKENADYYATQMEAAHQLAENARILGYDADSDVIKLATEEWFAAEANYKVYSKLFAESRLGIKMLEHPTTTSVWIFLHEQGYNDWVSAGIIGNMMAEVGGQTLDLDIYLKTRSYFGICQWNRTYPSVWNKNLEGQLNYLEETIQEEFDNFGFCYQSKFNYDSFCELRNERQAALAFAKCYERCASGSYGVRQKNAELAYEYFTGDN